MSPDVSGQAKERAIGDWRQDKSTCRVLGTIGKAPKAMGN